MISKYLQSTNSKTITNVLPKIVKNYNNSYHSSIGMAPNEVNEDNMHIVQMMFFRRATRKPHEQLNVGDKVRVQLKDRAFKKGYKPKYSDSVHTVAEKKKHYYLVTNSDKMYQRANLIKVNDVEENENLPDIANTLEERAKNLYKKKENVKYNIPASNFSERTLRKRVPTNQLEHEDYGKIIFT